MATASVTYSFSGGGNAVASQVNQDFSDVVTFLNNSVLHVDGSKQLTGQLSLLSGTDPTADDHAARKLYVDKYAKASHQRVSLSSVTGVTTSTPTTAGTITITDPGYNIEVWGTCHCLMQASGFSITTSMEMVATVDVVNASNLRIPMPVGEMSLAVSLPVTQHTTGTNCVVRFQVLRYAGPGTLNTVVDSHFSWAEVWYRAV